MKKAGGFTMKEYIEQNKLGVDYMNRAVNKRLAEHFKALGLTKVRKARGWVWVPKAEADRRSVDKLEAKLERLR